MLGRQILTSAYRLGDRSVVSSQGKTSRVASLLASASPTIPLSCRSFHATRQREVLPIIAVGTLLVVGRYSWRALNRMDDEWEDYQWQLQEYERQRRKDQVDADSPVTIGVDLGTIYLKLSTMSAHQPELVPTAQGDRYRFTGILMNQDAESMVVGRPAEEKFYYPPEPVTDEAASPAVVLPYRKLQQASQEEATDLVQKVVLPTVGEAMDRLASSRSEDTTARPVRTVLTLPPVFYNQHKEGIFDQNYHDDSHHTITVPDPVAAIWGAQSLDLLPTPSTKEERASSSTLVIDVGGLMTSVSLVREDRVIGTSCLDDVGGETFVQQMAQRILEETGDDTFRQDPMSLALIQKSAQSSTLELVQKTQAKIHIPFLFMGRKPDNPHLEMTLSRNVLDQMVQDYWTKHVVPKLVENGELSSSLPPPTSATTLITSAVTKVLEESGEIPTNIEHILLVGGGAKYKLFEQAFQDGISALMGPSPQKLVLPDPSLRAELTAMGAAALLPNYDYNYDRGLERIVN